MNAPKVLSSTMKVIVTLIVMSVSGLTMKPILVMVVMPPVLNVTEEMPQTVSNVLKEPSLKTDNVKTSVKVKMSTQIPMNTLANHVTPVVINVHVLTTTVVTHAQLEHT